MKINKIEKLVESVKPEFVHNDKHKVVLRNKLLNSKHFNQIPIYRIIKSRDFIVAFSFVIIIGLIYVFKVLPHSNQSLPGIISRLNTTYAGFALPGKVNSFESNLKLASRENEPLLLRNSIIQDERTKSVFCKTYDIYTGETLYELMVLDSNRYYMQNPKLQFHNTAGRKSITAIHAVAADSLLISVDSSGRHFNKLTKEIVMDEGDAFIKITRNRLSNPEMNSLVPKEEYVKVFHDTNLDEYLRITPLDIVNEINLSDSLEIINDLSADSENENYTLLKIKSKLSKAEFRSLIIDLSSDSSDNAKNFLNKIKSGTDSGTLNWIVKMADTTAPVPNSFMELAPQKIKIVKIGNEDSRIHQINYAVKKNSNILNLAEVTFSSHKVVPFREEYFNPSEQNLIERK